MSGPSVEHETVVEVEVDQLHRRGSCIGTQSCDKYVDQFTERMVGRYVARPNEGPPPVVSALLDVRDLDFGEYMASLRKIHKGAAIRQARKSDDAGFICDRFAWKNHIPDVVEINTSLESRSGGEMREAYRRSVEKMGGAPIELHTNTSPGCLVHGIWNWGIFEPKPGHQQGEVVVDRRLLAYVRFKRQGSLGIYTTLLGHGEELGRGIMYRLHYAIMEWIASHPQDVPELTHVLYGGAADGNDGLKMWKKRCGFVPGHLRLKSPLEGKP